MSDVRVRGDGPREATDARAASTSGTPRDYGHNTHVQARNTTNEKKNALCTYATHDTAPHHDTTHDGTTTEMRRCDRFGRHSLDYILARAEEEC